MIEGWDGPSHTEGTEQVAAAGDSSSRLIPHLSPLSRKQRGGTCELSWFSPLPPLPPLMESGYHLHSRQLLPPQLIFSENVLTDRYTSLYSFIQSRHFTTQSSGHSKFTITFNLQMVGLKYTHQGLRTSSAVLTVLQNLAFNLRICLTPERQSQLNNPQLVILKNLVPESVEGFRSRINCFSYTPNTVHSALHN